MSLNRFAELHWGEGMLLKPQHFQVWQRHVHDVVNGTVGGLQPYAWGLRRLDLDHGALENSILSIRALEARLPDGTVVSVPDNADLPELRLKEALEEAGADPIVVRLGVPLFRERSGNLETESGSPDGLPRRNRLDEMQVGDENTGDNIGPIEVRRLNARLLLPGDPALEHCSVMPLLRVYREGQDEDAPPRADEQFVPPTLELEGSPRLHAIAREILHLASARATALTETITGQQLDFSVEAGGSPEMLLKLHVLNGFLAYFQPFLRIPRLHPVHVFCELSRLAGELAIFSVDRRTPPLPSYEHADPGAGFQQLFDVIQELLGRMYVTRAPHRSFEAWGRYWVARIEPHWLAAGNVFYIAVDSELEPEEVRAIMERQVSIGSKQTIEELAKLVVPGIGRRYEPRAPRSLQDKPRRVYFRLDRTGGDEELTVGTQELALFNGSGKELHFSLYLVEGAGDKGHFEID